VSLVRNKLIPVLAGFTFAVLQVTNVVLFPFNVLIYWPAFMSGILAWLSIHWKQFAAKPITHGRTGNC